MSRTAQTMIRDIEVQRPYFYCHHCHCGRYPLDEVLGLSAGRMAYPRRSDSWCWETVAGATVQHSTCSREDLQGLANQLGLGACRPLSAVLFQAQSD